MDTKIITVINQKGGAGKTTTSMQLAGSLSRRGFDVLVVDADKQNTSVRWSSSADEENPFPATVISLAEAGKNIHREIHKQIGKYEIIIIDCPPSVDSPIGGSALVLADLAIVPVVPSPPDLWASINISQLIEQAALMNTDLKSYLLVNRMQPNTSLSKDVMEVLPEFNMPIFETKFHQRTVFAESGMYGATVHDFGKKQKKAIEEVEALANEVLPLIDLPENQE